MVLEKEIKEKEIKYFIDKIIEVEFFYIYIKKKFSLIFVLREFGVNFFVYVDVVLRLN